MCDEELLLLKLLLDASISYSLFLAMIAGLNCDVQRLWNLSAHLLKKLHIIYQHSETIPTFSTFDTPNALS